MDTSALFDQADAFLLEHEKDKARLTVLKTEISRLQKKETAFPEELKLLDDVRVFLQTLAEATRNQVMSGLEKIVTTCLQIVFGANYSFEIEVETKRNNTGLEFYVINASGEHAVRMKPTGNMGGGVLDTVAIGLRFGLMEISNPKPEGPALLDEPAKMISGDRIMLIADLLKELQHISKRQIIMVTHHAPLEELLEGVIRAKSVDGISTFIQ